MSGTEWAWFVGAQVGVNGALLVALEIYNDLRSPPHLRMWLRRRKP
ncbi:hypothetical protein [Pimelobacter simplex]